jgi:hypothetical protein
MPQYQGVWTLEQQAQAQSNQQWVTDPNFKNTTLLLQADGTGSGSQNQTFLDGSTNNFFITRNGNTTQGSFSPFSQAPGYWGNYFNGSSNLATAANPNLAFGTGDVTVEFWINTLSNSDNGLFGTTNESAWNANSWSFKYAVNGIVLYNGNSGGDLWNIPVGFLHDGAWHHVAIVRSSGTWQVFVDGISKGTTTTQGARSLGDNSWRFAVGSIEPSNNDLKYTGYLSNFRLNNTALYSSNFTPSTVPLTANTGIKLLTCQSNRFIDNSGSAITFTTGGTPSVQAFGPFAPALQWTPDVVGGSGYFDGSSDSLTIAANANLAIGTSDFCIEWFYYQTSTQTSATPLCQWGGGASNWILQYNTSNFIFYYNNGSSSISFAYTPVPNQWTHGCVCRSGSTMSLYLNGVRVNTQSDAFSIANTTGITVGRNPDGGQDCTGYIAYPRLVVGSSVYNPSLTTLTVPTAPLTAVSGTQFLAGMTNAGIYDGTMANNLETVGNAQVATSPVKYGSGSMYFGGTGTYPSYATSNLVGPANAGLYNFRTSNFTIEAWINLSVTTTGRVIVSSGYNADTGAGGWTFTYRGDISSLSLSVNANVVYSKAWSPSANIWYHVAVTRAENILRFFVDGVQIGTTSTSTDDITGSSTIVVGGNSGGANLNFLGYIDDLRITRVARYYANFTPPQQALPRQ